MVHKTDHNNSASSAQEEAAFVDAYDARMAGGSADQVPAQWREEIESMVRLHERVSALPLPEVAPSVRAIVLGAAAQVVAERPVSVWARLSHWLLRPGPILVGATAAAVVFALAVRQEKPVAPVDGGAVAMLENAPAAPAAAEPVAAPAVAPEAAPAGAAAPQVAAAETGAGQAAAAAARPASEPAAKAIAAQPASVAPQGAADLAANAAEEKKAQAAQAAKAMQWNADSAKQAQRLDQPAERQEAEAADEQLAKASRRPGIAPMMGAVGNQNAKVPSASADDRAQKDQAAVQQEFAQAPPTKAVQGIAAAGQKADNEREIKAEDSAKATDQLAAAKVTAVAKLRAEAERTVDPAKRAALLQQLVAAASQAGDAKTAAWAKEQLVVANRANANNASGGNQSGKAKAAAESAPAAAPDQKAAPEKPKSTSY